MKMATFSYLQFRALCSVSFAISLPPHLNIKIDQKTIKFYCNVACHQIYHIKAFEVCLMGRAREEKMDELEIEHTARRRKVSKHSRKRERERSDKNKGAFRKLNRDAIACFYELDFLPASCPRFILFSSCVPFWRFFLSFQLLCHQGMELYLQKKITFQAVEYDEKLNILRKIKLAMSSSKMSLFDLKAV